MRAVSTWIALAALTACDASDEPMQVEDLDEPEARDCAIETRADAYALGMRKLGGEVEVAIVEATPAPPARGDNTWRVRVQDAAGSAMAAAITVDTYMPDHQHGSSIRTDVVETEIDGEFVLDPVNLFMPGLWEVTLDLTLDDGTPDAVVFRFCVDP